MNRAIYDVAIVGAGPAGLAAALTLRRCGSASVLLVDAGPAERPRIGESVPPELLVVLAKLGLGERFAAAEHRPCPGSSVVWGRDQVGHRDAIASPMGPAWRLDRPGFDRMLIAAAEEAGVELRWHESVVTPLANAGPTHVVGLTDGRREAEIEARWLIDASGPKARLARSFGARRELDDRLFALVRRLAPSDQPLDHRIHVEATPTGWWYAARLPDERVLAMFVTDKQTLRERGSATEVWTEGLAAARHLGPKLRAGTSDCNAGPPDQILAVHSSLLDQLAGDRWLAIGDAAASYDPIAGQGLLKALDDGVTAGRELARALGAEVRAPAIDRVARVQARYREYRRARTQMYVDETRWPDAGFWARRRPD